jgi:hypothetical protein
MQAGIRWLAILVEIEELPALSGSGPFALDKLTARRLRRSFLFLVPLGFCIRQLLRTADCSMPAGKALTTRIF